MRVTYGALVLALVTFASAPSLGAQQLRSDSYRWYFGVQGSGLLFETQTQKRTFAPLAGVHVLVVGKRGGLLIGVEEAFGDDESSAFGDIDAPNGARTVTFDRIRKYSATLMAFPVNGTMEPYLGAGVGIHHTVNTQVEGFFTSPQEAALSTAVAKDLGSTGFGSLVGGLQFRVTPMTLLYFQYQVTTSPAAEKLLRGPTHTLAGGFRFGLGKAREDIRGGGY